MYRQIIKINKNDILTVDNNTFFKLEESLAPYILNSKQIGNVTTLHLDKTFYLMNLNNKLICRCQNENILVEHTSANPDYLNFHIGNFSCSIVGQSLVEFLKFLNKKVVSMYYVNDLGERVRIMSVIKNVTNLRDEQLYTEYITNKSRWSTQLIDKHYENIHEDERIKLRNTIVDLNLKKILSLLQSFNVYFDKLVYESEVSSIKNLSKYILTDNLPSYNINGKIIYLLSTKKYPLYALGDLGLTIKQKLSTKYDLVYTVCGKDHQLHFNNIQKIVNLEGYDVTKLNWIHLSSLKLDNKKVSKSGNNFITLLQVSKMKNLEIQILRLYILLRGLEYKTALDYGFFIQYIEVFHLITLKIPEKLRTQNIIIDGLEKFYRFYSIFWYHYVSHKAFINQLRPICKTISEFFYYYGKQKTVNEGMNSMHDEYNLIRNTVLKILVAC